MSKRTIRKKKKKKKVFGSWGCLECAWLVSYSFVCDRNKKGTLRDKRGEDGEKKRGG